MEHNTINNMKKALLIVCLFISVIASGQNNFFWSHNSSGGYGLLYNWYAATSTDKITSSDDWVVPTNAQWATLKSYVSNDGNKLKQKGLLYWVAPNSDATNEFEFNGRGSGERSFSTGVFANLKSVASWWQFDAVRVSFIRALDSEFVISNLDNVRRGFAIRLLYVGVGTPTEYVGNNGYVYRVVQIGTQYWLAQNLRETKWRNGTDITNVTDNAAWSALTTPAWCVYNNNFKYR